MGREGLISTAVMLTFDIHNNPVRLASSPLGRWETKAQMEVSQIPKVVVSG
jgi:hypothetical protein